MIIEIVINNFYIRKDISNTTDTHILMVEAAPQTEREQIKQGLIAKSEEFWANFDSYPTVL